MSERRRSDREVKAQIYGVLVSKLRMACIVDGDEIDIDRYHDIQMKIADKLERQFVESVVNRD